MIVAFLVTAVAFWVLGCVSGLYYYVYRFESKYVDFIHDFMKNKDVKCVCCQKNYILAHKLMGQMKSE